MQSREPHSRQCVRGAANLAVAGALALLFGACVGAIDGAQDQPPSASGQPDGPGRPRVPGNSTMDPPGNVPSAGGFTPTGTDAPRFSRLSHAQWENTVRDLLRLPQKPGLAQQFSPDPVTGFDNDATALAVTPDLRTDYERAVDTLVERVTSDPAALARIVPASATGDVKARGMAFISEFGARAHRRPLDAQEKAEYLALFEKGPSLLTGAEPFVAGVKVVLRAILQSPYFLYRTELGTRGGDGRVALDDHERAAKLSYALTGSMPDDALFAAASRGSLRTKQGLTQEAERLLGGEQAISAADAFHHHLLHVSGYEHIDKDKKSYPLFVPELAEDMAQEATLFVRDLFQGKRGLRDLLLSRTTFVNRRLAAVYGLKGISSDTEFKRAELDATQRAGILTRAGFLASYAGGVDPDPIKRGVFVNEAILCAELPSPVAGVPPVPEGTAKTNRARIELHTGKGTCGEGCHANLLNPPGFALEGYDALGQHRTMDNGQPVDTTASYPFSIGRRTFKDGIEMSKILADLPETHACYARHWYMYLQGRALVAADAASLERLARRSNSENLAIRDLVMDAVTSDQFFVRPN